MTSIKAPGRVLLVDDDPDIRESLSNALAPSNYVLSCAADGASALAIADGFHPEVVLLDLGLPDISGLDLISSLHELDELTGIVVLTATSEIAVVVKAMRLGAENFLVKPVTLATLEEVLGRTLSGCRRDRQHRALLARSATHKGPTLIGSSRGMQRVKELIAQVAVTEATVLLQGESGTGKGLAAEEIHRLSNRADAPFLDLNCAGLSGELLESELFGHERGAFTGASRTKPGLLEIASGGTVFLDEVGEMPLEIQSRFLKVLESQSFRRVGGVRDVSTDVRLVTATNRDIKAMVRTGAFRKDLYYRLNVFAIEVPPLRERPEDVLELAHYFLGQLDRAMGADISGFDLSSSEMLTAYDWPGNARELRNVVERALILARSGEIHVHHLPADLRQVALSGGSSPLKPLADMESDYIARVLEATNGNIKRAAEILQVSRTTLYNKIRTYHISVPS